MIVRLTPHELHLAAQVGIARRLKAIQRGYTGRNGQDADHWGADIEGAAAELAVSKLLGRYWTGTVGLIDQADVAGEDATLQVRHSTRPDASLIIRETDDDGDVFYLVTGRLGDYDVKGWITAGEGKAPFWRRAPNGRPAAYFVPQAALWEPRLG